MNSIINSKIVISLFFLIVGGAIGNQLPVIKIIIDEPIQKVERTVDADGVPILADYKNPVVNGQKMKLSVFLTTYCDGIRATNRTCAKVADYAWRT